MIKGVKSFAYVALGIVAVVMIYLITAGKQEKDPKTQIIKDITENGTVCNEACSVDKVSGNYAKGNMPMAYWIANKENGKWKVVIGGNGIPSCAEVDKYTVPREIYGNCIEESTQLRF